MRRTQLVGLLLWRGGLLLVAVTVLFEAARWLFRFIELPPQLEVGFGLVAVGVGFIFASLVLERVQDHKAEGDLRE